MTIARIFALGGVGFQAAALLLLVAMHFVRPRRLLSDAVSNYVMWPTARLFLIYDLVGTVAALFFAVAIVLAQGVQLPHRVAFFLLLVAVLRIAVLEFPTDVERLPATRTGRMHVIVAATAFALAYMAMAAADAHLDGLAPQWLVETLRVLRWIVAAGLVGVVVAFVGPLRPAFGYSERIFLAGSALWFLLLGAGLVISG